MYLNPKGVVQCVSGATKNSISKRPADKRHFVLFWAVPMKSISKEKTSKPTKFTV